MKASNSERDIVFRKFFSRSGAKEGSGYIPYFNACDSYEAMPCNLERAARLSPPAGQVHRPDLRGTQPG